MEYTVQKLAALAGVSPRTLRWYDKMGLLRPARISGGGYRIYGTEQVNRLQQILFYRELGVELDAIRSLLDAPSFDATSALKAHKSQLLARRAQLDQLIETLEKTLAAQEGREPMSDRDKFEGFKREMVEENERKYGKEARERYGEKTVDRANRKVMDMSKADHDRYAALAEQVLESLVAAMDAGDPAGELGLKTAALHREWLGAYWDHYSPEAHLGLAQMYVEDARFTAHYDARRPGAALFLRDAIAAYVETLPME